MTDSFDIDFLPAGYVARRHQLVPGRYFAVIGVSLVVVAGLVAVLGHEPFDHLSLAIERDHLLSQMKQEPFSRDKSISSPTKQPQCSFTSDQETARICSCLEAIDDARSSRLSILKVEILRDLKVDPTTGAGSTARRTPPSHRVPRSNSALVESDFSITICALADDRDELARFVEALRATLMFDRLTLSHVVRRTASPNTAQGDGFEFTLNLKTPTPVQPGNGNTNERS